MAITKETQIGKIEVVGKYKSVQVRTDTVVMEDGEELSRKYHRHPLGTRLQNIILEEHAEVQAVCNAVPGQPYASCKRRCLSKHF